MTANLTATIRRELAVAYDAGLTMAQGPVLYSKHDVVTVGAERITAAVEESPVYQQGIQMLAIMEGINSMLPSEGAGDDN